MRTGDGRTIPPLLKTELNRLRRRLVITLDMIREVEAERQQAVEAQDDTASRTIRALCKLRGIGDNFAAVLTREVFYRSFENRRQIASYLGLAPTPFQSGGMDRDRRINRAGNSRAVSVIGRPPTGTHLEWVRCPPSNRWTPNVGGEGWRQSAHVEP